jgi:hypothetical protein
VVDKYRLDGDHLCLDQDKAPILVIEGADPMVLQQGSPYVEFGVLVRAKKAKKEKEHHSDFIFNKKINLYMYIAHINEYVCDCDCYFEHISPALTLSLFLF